MQKQKNPPSDTDKKKILEKNLNIKSQRIIFN